uniref:Uncharacterized protein n=1 Tax=Anguilla anguilla TaxID=7936 RepID=A0A0E9UZ68_ANGAN
MPLSPLLQPLNARAPPFITVLMRYFLLTFTGT